MLDSQIKDTNIVYECKPKNRLCIYLLYLEADSQWLRFQPQNSAVRSSGGTSEQRRWVQSESCSALHSRRATSAAYPGYLELVPLHPL